MSQYISMDIKNAINHTNFIDLATMTLNDKNNIYKITLRHCDVGDFNIIYDCINL